jgi:hypothetical protein
VQTHSLTPARQFSGQTLLIEMREARRIARDRASAHSGSSPTGPLSFAIAPVSGGRYHMSGIVALCHSAKHPRLICSHRVWATLNAG